MQHRVCAERNARGRLAHLHPVKPTHNRVRTQHNLRHVHHTVQQVTGPCPNQPRRSACNASAASSSSGDAASSDGNLDAPQKESDAPSGIKGLLRSLDGLWSKFVPMALLFFFMAFVNTILDSLKDTLVITAAGGGAQVIPFLTVYGVFPFSIAFLVVFNFLAGFMSRETLFNVIIVGFLSFLVLFAFVLYPNHQLLHPHALADSWATVVPSGLLGAVGMLRNWTFTVFYCVSEMWGDVGLSLLFWGLANETTCMNDAPVLYPIFGIGANIAQVMAGQCLRVLATSVGSGDGFTAQIQALSMVLVFMCLCILGLHHYISNRSKTVAVSTTRSPPSDKPTTIKHTLVRPKAEQAQEDRTSEDVATSALASEEAVHTQDRTTSGADSSTSSDDSSSDDGKRRMTFRDAIRYCWKTPTIRCLAFMAIAQGLCTNLVEFAWKSHLRILHPTPQAFSMFMGDVATWTGFVTVGMMVLAPAAFKTLGWRKTARATPDFLLWVGGLFFVACAIYQVTANGVVSAAIHSQMLQVLGMMGALLYIISRSAKFSLFKPAEEMVYISLDARARLNGKATVDVFGAQFGKSSGSVMQQFLLVVTAGSLLHSLPVMIAMFVYVAFDWGRAVDRLSELVGAHTSMDSVDFADDDKYVEFSDTDGLADSDFGNDPLVGKVPVPS